MIFTDQAMMQAPARGASGQAIRLHIFRLLSTNM